MARLRAFRSRPCAAAWPVVNGSAGRGLTIMALGCPGVADAQTLVPAPVDEHASVAGCGRDLGRLHAAQAQLTAARRNSTGGEVGELGADGELGRAPED